MKLHVACLLLLVLLGGCASLPRGPGCVRIGPAGAACLLPPAALPAMQAQHVVTIEHDGGKDSFLGRLQIDAHALRLAGSSLFGTPLFTLVWDGQHIDMQPRNERLPPDLVLAMLQAAIVKPDRLRPRLHGITLQVHARTDGGQLRELYEHGHLVARIRVPADPLSQAGLTIDVPPAKLRLRLQPLESR